MDNSFYKNWIAKADSYTEDSLPNHFDRFVSMYIIFNSLYMKIADELVLDGYDLPKKFSDNKAATQNVVQFLKSNFYINNLLNDEESINSLKIICEIISSEEYHIILNWGRAQKDKDLKLLKGLESKGNVKALSILKLFYNIRCNIFHGHKGFDLGQKKLLIPVNQLLRKTIDIVMEKLKIQIVTAHLAPSI